MSGYDLPMLTPVADAATLAPTRASLHALAEHVLAPDLYRSTGRIGLRRAPGGFGQPEHVVDGRRRRARIDGTSLVIDDEGETWHEITTLGAAAGLLDLPLGTGTGVYEPSTPCEPDTVLPLDGEAASDLADWLRLVDVAVEEFRHRNAALRPSVAQLWPEHFDLACSIGEVNYGGSPGDDDRPEPYLYVGPWSPPSIGGFWNEPYGAALGRSEVATVDDALAFFERGSEEIARAPQ